jgi:excisionase family DNA binding protein
MAGLAEQIASHLHPDGSVTVPPRIARWLERKAGVTADQRLRLRDTDPDAYTVLAALHLAAMGGDLRSVNGTNDAGRQGDTEDSEWLTAAEAAEVASVTTRAITGWCRSGRLPADRHGRSWRINRQHLHIVQALAA